MSEKSEKIETFISDNFRSSWFFLTILTYKIFDFDLKKLEWKIFWKFSQFFGYKWEILADFGISEKIVTFIGENLKIFGYDLDFFAAPSVNRPEFMSASPISAAFSYCPTTPLKSTTRDKIQWKWKAYTEFSWN